VSILANELSRRLSSGTTLREMSALVGDVSHEMLRLISKGQRSPSPELARVICAKLRIDDDITSAILLELAARRHDNIASAHNTHEEGCDAITAAMVQQFIEVFKEHSGRTHTAELDSFLRTTYGQILRKRVEK